jgi:tetratricopeptide (TPR) repeat protein
MKKLKQLSVALVALSIVLMCKSARAQYMRPVPINVPPPYLNQFDPPKNNSQHGSVSALYQRAFAESDRGNYAAEVQIYSQIVRIDPQAANAYYNRGLVKKNKLNDRAGAIQDFQSAAAIYRQKGENSMFRDCINKLQSLGASY